MESQKIIDANDRSVREILDKVKYHIDVFQREYKWGVRQIEQLIDDITSRFLADYQNAHTREDVEKYGKYYLGSIVICSKDGKRSIIDGQQRLTSLTLLLIYLNNLQKDREDSVPIKDLIFSEKFAKKSFNLQVDDREECISSLYTRGDYDASDKNESVKNIVERYRDIVDLFPEELKGDALPYFLDWLTENVIFVEISTFSDEDAYTIFETMNDRGLNLTSAEMLKGYLISNLDSQEDKLELNELWKKRILQLKEIDKEEDLEFFKSWLRAKYAESIRQGKRGSENEDFEKIGTRFHSWVRDNKEKIGLKNKMDFYKFIKQDFDFYIKLYLKINSAAENPQKNLESIYYIYQRGFTLYPPILMAPIKISDDEETINKKLALVSKFLEMFIVFRSINFRTLGYSAIRYTMFSLVKEIRNVNIKQLAEILKKKASEFEQNLEGMKNLRLNGQNKRFIHFLLARITKYIEDNCSIPSNFQAYIDPELKKPFEVEHIWSDIFEEHKEEFDQRDDWEEYRNKIGALILLPRGFNQSYGKLPYSKKLPHYFGQNILAKTLNEQCYNKNPTFLQFIKNSKLPFKPYTNFKKKEIIERTELYQRICEKIYDINEFDKIAGNN